MFALPPYRGKWPQIWIAAHGPRMLRAVGRYGDGFFPGFAHSPREYAGRLDAVRAAASDAGRDPMSIVPALWMPLITGPTRAQVDEALESEVIKAWALTAPDEFFAQHGTQRPLGVGFSGGQDLLPQDWDEQTALSYIKGIAPEVMDDLLLAGTPEEVIDRAAEWRDCGVRYMVLVHVNFLQRSVRNALAAMAPFYKVVRGLKKL